MEKFLQKLAEAEKIIKTADHMIYMVFPMIKDKRLILRVLSEIKTAVSLCITSILQHEYLYKRVNLYKNPKENFKTFEEKCAKNYEITKQEIEIIKELFETAERHKKSSMEFTRDEKVIILSDKLEPRALTLEKTKEFLEISKNILRKTQINFNKK